MPVHVRMDSELLASELGDEDFFEQADAWQPDKDTGTRDQIAQSMQRVDKNRRKPKKGR